MAAAWDMNMRCTQVSCFQVLLPGVQHGQRERAAAATAATHKHTCAASRLLDSERLATTAVKSAMCWSS